MLVLLISQTLNNSSFELWSYINKDNPFAWDTIRKPTSSCTWVKDNTLRRIGNASIKITIDATTSGYDCGIAQSKGVSANTTYNMSAWVLDNDPNITASVYARCFDDNNNLTCFGTVATSTDDPSWQELSGTFTTDANCRYLDFQIRLYDNGSAGGTVWIDALSLTTGTPPSELKESFTSPGFPSEWYEEDPLGAGTASGLVRIRTTSCPFQSSDSRCLGFQYISSSPANAVGWIMTDTLDFTSLEAETLRFYWRTSTSQPQSPNDTIKVQISTDLGTTWNTVWEWDRNGSTSPQLVVVPLDAYNGYEQVLLRFYIKGQTAGTGNRYFNVDSVHVKYSYVGRFNRLTNPSLEVWKTTTKDMLPDGWLVRNNRRPYSNIAQLWVMREDSIVHTGNYSLKGYFTTTQNPFVEQKVVNPFTTCNGFPESAIDSYFVSISAYLYDNDEKGKSRIGVVWYYRDPGNNQLTQTKYSPNYTTNQTVWQFFEVSDTLSFGPSTGYSFDSVKIRIRFYNEGAFLEAEDGATTYADDASLTLGCFVGSVLPLDVQENFLMSETLEYIRLSGTVLYVKLRKPSRVSIYDVSGKVILSEIREGLVQVSLRRGIYIIRIGNILRKLVAR